MGFLDWLLGKRSFSPPVIATHRLVPFEAEGGRGYVLERASDGQRLCWDDLDEDGEINAFPVAGVSRRHRALQSPAFDPGRTLTLVPEPDNEYDPNAVGVWDEARMVQVGYVPRELAPEVADWLRRSEGVNCLSMWEHIKDDSRVGLRVIVVKGTVHKKKV